MEIKGDEWKVIVMNQNLALMKIGGDGIELDGDQIPNWVLVEVFLRLSPNVLCRFKLVSKQWLSIILDPCFVSLYYSRVPRWTFISTFKTSCSLCPYYPNPIFPKVLVDTYSVIFNCLGLYVLPLPSPTKYYRIYGVSNGLVLYDPLDENYATASGNRIRICNPVTRQWIALPPHSGDGQAYGVHRGFFANVEDGVLVSYTVVLWRCEEEHVSMEEYLSEIGEWNKYVMGSNGGRPSKFKYSECVGLNGTFHWMLSKEDRLFAYNPRKYPCRMRHIDLPGVRLSDERRLCVAYQGKLRYLGLFYDWRLEFCGVDIWVLNDYSSEDWHLQHRVNNIDILHHNPMSNPLLPISFHPYDSDIVYFGSGSKLISCNIKTRKLEIEEDQYGRLTYFTLRYVTLLVIPPSPISLSPPSN